MATFGINNMTIAGRVGSVDVKMFSGGEGELLKFSVAVQRSKKNTDGTYSNDVDWFECVKFKPTDYEKNNIVKGATVIATGSFTSRKYKECKYWQLNVEKVMVVKTASGDMSDDVADAYAEEAGEVEPMARNDLGSQGRDDLPF